MARTKQDPKISPQGSQILGAIISSITSLLNAHCEAIEKVRDESESKIVVVGFSTEIDCSNTEPSVKTKIRFAQTVTDMRVARLGDPNQTEFTLYDQQALDAEKLELAKAESDQAELAEKEQAGADAKAKKAQEKADKAAAKEQTKADKAAAKAAKGKK